MMNGNWEEKAIRQFIKQLLNEKNIYSQQIFHLVHSEAEKPGGKLNKVTFLLKTGQNYPLKLLWN